MHLAVQERYIQVDHSGIQTVLKSLLRGASYALSRRVTYMTVYISYNYIPDEQEGQLALSRDLQGPVVYSCSDSYCAPVPRSCVHLCPVGNTHAFCPDMLNLPSSLMEHQLLRSTEQSA